MKRIVLSVFILLLLVCVDSSAQNYKSERLENAAKVLGLQISDDILLPDTSILLQAKDRRAISLRTDLMGVVEHIGIPLFNDMMRYLQPSPVYDFLEYALLNWKYKVNANQLYLSKVIFKLGTWDTLLNNRISECECSIENRDDKLYIVTWKQEQKEIAVVGIPIDYELLNNDTRRNMERILLKELSSSTPIIKSSKEFICSEDKLSIYGTEGLFVYPGESYIIELLNQNTYYKLTTINETVDTIIHNKPVRMSMEAVLPILVNDIDFPAETFANLMICESTSIPDITMNLDFHLSNYHRTHITMPLSQLRSFFNQQGCKLYFAYNGKKNDYYHGVMFASNLGKGYNHLFTLRIHVDQLTSKCPTASSEVYLYIPPIDKEKLFGKAPTKKSGVKF